MYCLVYLTERFIYFLTHLSCNYNITFCLICPSAGTPLYVWSIFSCFFPISFPHLSHLSICWYMHLTACLIYFLIFLPHIIFPCFSSVHLLVPHCTFDLFSHVSLPNHFPIFLFCPSAGTSLYVWSILSCFSPISFPISLVCPSAGASLYVWSIFSCFSPITFPHLFVGQSAGTSLYVWPTFLLFSHNISFVHLYHICLFVSWLRIN